MCHPVKDVWNSAMKDNGAQCAMTHSHRSMLRSSADNLDSLQIVCLYYI